MEKKLYYEDEQDLEGQKNTAQIVDFGVSLSVTAAINCVYYASGCIRERKDLYRQRVKQLCNLAVKSASQMEMRMKSVMRDKSYWLDYSDRVIDEAQDDITSFRRAIEKVLMDANFPDATLYSYIECARVLLDMSVKQFDCVMERAEEDYGHNYSGIFFEFRAGDVFGNWDKMCYELYDGFSIDLNTPEVMDAFDVVSRRFGRGEYVSACREEAHAKNPDFVENRIKVKG